MAINIQRFNDVVAAAKSNAAGNARWTRAIDKASAAILSGELIGTALRNGAIVTSPNGSYFMNGHWQRRAATRIWVLYETAPNNRESIRLPADEHQSPPTKTTKCLQRLLPSQRLL